MLGAVSSAPVGTLGHAVTQHIPAGHPYPVSVTPDGVEALADPPIPGAEPGRWWPHPAFSTDWVSRTRADLVHVHFGFEHLSPEDLRSWTAALQDRHIGLVLTVHDLVNPHLGPSEHYDALLSVLLEEADAVTTLTPGAAAEIARRWGREAVAHPHPRVVDADWVDRPRTPTDGWVVGVHAKSLRASFDVDAVLDAARLVPALGGTLRVHVHDDVLDPGHPRHDARLATLRGMTGVDLRVHGPLDDAALWSDLLEIDLALVPYRFGTHSGWVEMCHDLGADILVAGVGHMAEQRPVRVYTDSPSLADALTTARDDHDAGRRPRRPAAEDRRREQEAVRAVHEAVYAQCLAAGARGQ